MASPIDTTYSFVKETVSGTTPATPAFKYFDYESGSDLTYTGKMLDSSVMKQNRAKAGFRKAAFAVGGSLKTQFRRDTTVDMLLESLLSGTFTSNVLKGGNTDSTLTCEKFMKDATNMYYRYTGVSCVKFGLSVASDGNAEASFDFTGMGRTTSNAIVPSATYTAATQGTLLAGLDVGTITVGGLSATYTSLDLSIAQNRDPQFALGSANAIGLGCVAPREIKLTLKMYRKDLAAEGIFMSDTPVAASITLGSGTGNIYTIALPAVVGTIPADEVNGSSALVSVDLMAGYDNTAQTDITITKS